MEEPGEDQRRAPHADELRPRCVPVEGDQQTARCEPSADAGHEEAQAPEVLDPVERERHEQGRRRREQD
jgi:hypothetical protein